MRISHLLDDIISSSNVIHHFNQEIQVPINETIIKPLSEKISDIINSPMKLNKDKKLQITTDHTFSAPPSPSRKSSFNSSRHHKNQHVKNSKLNFPSFSPVLPTFTYSYSPREDSDKEQANISLIQTQEILLHSLIKLLYSLALNSAKVI